MIKLYTEKDYYDMACQANAEAKKLIKVQEEREFPYEVYDYEKKTIKVPIYNEEGEIIGYEDKEVDDLEKPIMVKEIDPETGETILVHKHHTEYKTETVEYLEIVDNPENFERCFFKTSLGFIRRKAYMKVTGEYKDFLADIAPGLSVGDAILTYTSDLTPQQATVTQQFINECKERYNNDFNGVQNEN